MIIPKRNLRPGRKTIGWMVLGLALVGTGVLGAIRDFRYGGDLVWAASYTSAIQEAKSTSKPILISFHSSECDACSKMDAETFTDPAVISLSQQYICVRADARQETNLIEKYHVAGFPTTVIVNQKGEVIEQKLGYLRPEELARKLTAGLVK